MLTLDKIYHAKFVLKQVARKTDLIAATRLCPGTDLYLKTDFRWTSRWGAAP